MDVSLAEIKLTALFGISMASRDLTNFIEDMDDQVLLVVRHGNKVVVELTGINTFEEVLPKFIKAVELIKEV